MKSAHSQRAADKSSQVQCDRWLEIDLYWFDRSAKQASVDEFWDRYAPLITNAAGWKGVILNVGWLLDYVLEWNGHLNSAIKFPRDMKTYPWFRDAGQLTGSTKEREEMYRARFASADQPQTVNYDAWTHADLKELAAMLRTVALERHNIAGLRVGSFVLGWKNIYAGEFSSFGLRHPNAFRDNFPNLVASLSPDKTPYGAFSQGIPESTPFTEFFGKQWGHLSRSVGLDAIVLRDSLLGVGVYSRRGPYGKTAPDNPAKVEAWHLASADLVRQTKMANPQALVIGYSSAASAVGDWRTNCFDLERIAQEGYLDAWIDQTWAGAWNEVGQRPYTFWNAQTLGWTYQLSYVLVHAAILATSKVRHYILTETFDAWESWDVIHVAPQRLRWGIWAFSHAAVKTPHGLKMPAGSYISWCNKGKQLLSDADVDFLKQNTDRAFADAKATEKIFGPTLVYCRSAMQWQSDHAPSVSIGEWIDEQSAAFSKWSVPVLSITRTEYLAQVESDLFVLQTPNHLGKQDKSSIIAHLQSGRPTLVIGRTVGGLDPDVAELVGISTRDAAVGPFEFVGTLDGQTGGIFAGLPNTFPIYQPFARNQIHAENALLYSVRGSPCLIFNNTNGKQVLFWDPPETAAQVPNGDDFGFSLDQVLGSTTPFVLVARKLNELLRQNQSIHVEHVEVGSPVMYTAWLTRSGKYRILVADLEEGVNHTGNPDRELSLVIPSSWSTGAAFEYTEVEGRIAHVSMTRRIPVRLRQAESVLYTF
jgi:hypothetical protein